MTQKQNGDNIDISNIGKTIQCDEENSFVLGSPVLLIVCVEIPW